MILPSDILRNPGDVGADTLLTTPILVQRNVQAHPSIRFHEVVTSRQPFSSKLQVFRVWDAVVIVLIFDVHIVWWRCDNEVNTLLCDGVDLQNVVVADSY